MSPATRAALSTAGRIGALTRWSQTPDRTAATAPARAAFNSKWERQVREKYPDLDEEAVRKLADAAKRLHFARLGWRSGAARRAKAAGTTPE